MSRIWCVTASGESATNGATPSSSLALCIQLNSFHLVRTNYSPIFARLDRQVSYYGVRSNRLGQVKTLQSRLSKCHNIYTSISSDKKLYTKEMCETSIFFKTQTDLLPFCNHILLKYIYLLQNYSHLLQLTYKVDIKMKTPWKCTPKLIFRMSAAEYILSKDLTILWQATKKTC